MTEKAGFYSGQNPSHISGNNADKMQHMQVEINGVKILEKM